MTNDHTDFSALSIALHSNDTDVAREDNDDDDDDGNGNESDTNSFDSTQTDRSLIVQAVCDTYLPMYVFVYPINS